MTPKQQFICKLVGIILGALTPIVLALLTFMQGQSNRADALRTYDSARRRRRPSTHAPLHPVPVAEPTVGRKTNMTALAESVKVAADKAVDDTARVLVPPTTVEQFFGAKPRLVPVRALRKR